MLNCMDRGISAFTYNMLCIDSGAVLLDGYFEVAREEKENLDPIVNSEILKLTSGNGIILCQSLRSVLRTN